MQTQSQRPKGREGFISGLNVTIETLNLTKDLVSQTPAKAVFGSASAILTMIRVSLPVLCWSNTDSAGCVQDKMANDADYVELGMACDDVCTALRLVLDGKSEGDLDDSVRHAINQLKE